MLFEYLNKAFGNNTNMSETYAYFSEEVGDRDVTTACFALRHVYVSNSVMAFEKLRGINAL